MDIFSEWVVTEVPVAPLVLLAPAPAIQVVQLYLFHQQQLLIMLPVLLLAEAEAEAEAELLMKVALVKVGPIFSMVGQPEAEAEDKQVFQTPLGEALAAVPLVKEVEIHKRVAVEM
jgi:hypothetical protein